MRDRGLENEVLNVTNDKFNDFARKIFSWQKQNCPVYSQWSGLLHTADDQIPFLPIAFFKQKQILAKGLNALQVFESSSTGGAGASRHYVPYPDFYEANFLKGFRHFYGEPAEYCILALLPSYLERSNSSLVFMADKLISMAKPGSGFYLHNQDELLDRIAENESNGQKTLLLGVTYALLDLAEKYKGPPLAHTLIMETGGMKGRREEMIREDVHLRLKTAFGCRSIHSEYGMTEMMSQAYSKGDGIFYCPPWLKILIQDAGDPGMWLPPDKTGRICLIDLGNLYSCSFIATDDLGRLHADGSFEVLGRLDFSDTRGCNLMVV